jgi:hypothetical protein
VSRFRRETSPRRRGAAAGLVAVIIGVLASGYFVVSALAAPTPPTITVTFPAPAGVYNATGWSAGCSTAGICGTVTDSSTVTGVTLSIYQSDTGMYWDSGSFSSTTPVFNGASGTSNWSYPFTPPADGHYRVVVDATDEAGNDISDVTVAFAYKTTPPPAPRITAKPANPTTQTSADFTFTDRQWPDVVFWCSVDSAPVQNCTGGAEGELDLTGLTVGLHCLSVYVTDEAGNNSLPRTYCWDVEGRSTTFSVGGDLASSLYPGTSSPLDMTFTNPGSSPITIDTADLTSSNISITTNQPGCGSSNFQATGLGADVTIPADQFEPISLSNLNVPQADWPVISMIDTNTNQDACEGASLTLTYSGIEASGS